MKKKDFKKPHPLKGRKRPKEVREAISRAHKGKPKNYPSYLKGKKGILHPSFKHGKGYIRKYDHIKQAAWIQGVKRACNWKCFISGETEKLECHHLIGWAYAPTRYEIANGVLVSRSIHVDFQNKYGRGNNIPEQFEEYCEKYYNITTFPWRQGDHKPSFTLLEEKMKIETQTYQKRKEFERLVKIRSHEIVDGLYVNNNSVLIIYCSLHNTKSTVRAGHYKRAVFGTRCCSSAKQSVTTSRANRKRKKSHL